MSTELLHSSHPPCVIRSYCLHLADEEAGQSGFSSLIQDRGAGRWQGTREPAVQLQVCALHHRAVCGDRVACATMEVCPVPGKFQKNEASLDCSQVLEMY